MNELVIPQNFGAVSSRFINQQVEDDLSAGVQSSYGIVGYRGKVWRIKYRGEEIDLMRDDGDGPRASIEVVILRAAGHLSKIFYKNGYVEGSTEAPDCFSNNGVTPSLSAKEKQAATCAACPHNAWGSRITPAGKQGKACSDSKRVVVVPLNDLANEAYGGPMLLRVPAASLQDIAAYGQKMGQLGFPYFAVGTRVAFDTKEAFPKFIFGAIRPLSDAEADLILELRDDPRTQRVLSEEAPVDTVPQQVTLQSAFEQPPATAPVQQAPVQQAPVQQAPVQQAPVQQAPVQQAAPEPSTRRRNYAKQQAPVQQAPVQQAPVQQAPVQQAPVQQAPVQQAPVQQAQIVETAPTGVDDFDAQLDSLLDS